MDADTTRNKGSHEDIINKFKNHEYDILLGTQMISKGLDFPLVTLVGIINADTTLNMPDFRSAERTYSLLSQVSGRAGRSELEGEVILQTFNPDNYPKYDNYEAIDVSRTEDIPVDYEGIMGVPVTFLDKYNPSQFEIIGITKSWFGIASKKYGDQIQVDKNGKESRVTKLNDAASLEITSPPNDRTYYKVDGKMYIATYPRILIRRIKK